MAAESIAKIVLTGSSGKAGRMIMPHLAEAGYEVLGVDANAPAQSSATGNFQVIKADLTNLGETLEVFNGVDAVVHLANIPIPGMFTPTRTFMENTAMNYNVFSAAAQSGVKKVVWLSSDAIMGLPYDDPPKYVPVDENHPCLPATTYALSKLTGEVMAEHISRWSGIPFVGLRSCFLQGPQDYELYGEFQNDPHARRWHLWSYLDLRDMARACNLALSAETKGCEIMNIVAEDSVMKMPSKEIMAAVFPNAEVRADLGEHGGFFSNAKAGKVIGFVPQYSWRNI